MCTTGADLMQEIPNQKETIEELVNKVKMQWDALVDATELKKLRLKQAIEAQFFYRSLADLEIWMNESEHVVSSKDLGHDLSSTVTLRRRVTDLEDEWNTKKARIRELDRDMEKMLREDHFDADNVRENGNIVNRRFYGLEQPINARKRLLDEVLQTHEMRRDLDDEEQWIREKDLALNVRKQIPSGSFKENPYY